MPKITGMVRLRTLLRRLGDERGMTLVELLTVMGLLGIVMAAVVVLYISGVRAQTNMSSRFNAQTMLHTGLDRMRKDIHEACTETAQSGTSVTLELPSTGGGLCDGSNLVTWCTRGSGSPVVYALYRQTGTGCTNGLKLADYLTGGSIFGYSAPNSPAGSYSLARMHLDITVNATPATPDLAFHVVDDVDFGNSDRCVVGTNCPST